MTLALRCSMSSQRNLLTHQHTIRVAFVITKPVCEMYTDHRVGSGLAKWQSTVSQHLVTSRDAAAATRRILSLTAVHAAHVRLMVTKKYIKISHTHTHV